MTARKPLVSSPNFVDDLNGRAVDERHVETRTVFVGEKVVDGVEIRVLDIVVVEMSICVNPASVFGNGSQHSRIRREAIVIAKNERRT